LLFFMDEKKYQILLDEVRQNYGGVVRAHKIQEIQADLYARRYKWLEAINILLAAATSCGIITTIFMDEYIARLVAALLSVGTLFVTVSSKGVDLKSMEQRHRTAAGSFSVIRNQLLHIIARIHMGDELHSITDEYNRILDDLSKLSIGAPSASRKAVAKAEKALKNDDGTTFSEEEIDQFLPTSLQGGLT
jgi:hypothetical protein